MKKLSFFVCLIFFFLVFNLCQAQDFVSGQIMIDVKHEYLPTTPTPNGDDIAVISHVSIPIFDLLYPKFFLSIQKKMLDKQERRLLFSDGEERNASLSFGQML
jgi:hypothetical protein